LKIAVGLLIMVAGPVLITLGLLKPSFQHLFGEDPTARIVKHLLQVGFLVGIPYLVIRRMHILEGRMRDSAVTRILFGGVVILILADVIINYVLKPLASILVPDVELARAMAETVIESSLPILAGLLILIVIVYARVHRGGRIVPPEW